MYLEIDGNQLDCEPRAIDVIPAEAQESELAGGDRVYIESNRGVDIELIFGLGGLTADAIHELEIARGVQGLHTLTFENIHRDELIDVLVYMPKITRTTAGQGDGDLVYSEVTLLCHQVNPAFNLVLMEWTFFENAGYSTGDDKFRVSMPASGRFVSDGVSGYWFNVIGGAGNQIACQLRNATQGKDYFTTTAKFKTTTATGRVEDYVFATDRDFIQDDIVALDIDQVTSGAPAAGEKILVLQALCEMHGVSGRTE